MKHTTLPHDRLCRYTQESTRAGFTFVEILVVIAIIALFAVVSIGTFRSMYHNSAQKTAVLEIADALRDSRNNTLGAANDSVYGVHVGTTSVTRFTGSSYVAGAATNETYVFEGGVSATGTIVTSGTDIVFARLTGVPSAVGTIVVEDSDLTSSTSVVLYKTGLVEY